MSAFQDYITASERALVENPTLRRGQAYFNTLAKLHPALGEQVQGIEVDPFYDDDRIPSLLLWLQLIHPDTF